MSDTEFQIEQFVNHPPAEVWRAITEPELLAQWWAKGDIKAEVGHSFTLDMGPFGPQRCTVTEVDEPRRFTYRFLQDTADNTLDWRLEREGGGTRLLLTQSGLDPDNPFTAQIMANMPDGWRHEVLPRLVTLLDGGIR